METFLRKLLERVGVEADRVFGRTRGRPTPEHFVPALNRAIETNLTPDPKGVRRVAPSLITVALSYELHSRLDEETRSELEKEITQAAEQYITDHRYQVVGSLSVQILCDPYLRKPYEIRVEPGPARSHARAFVLVSAEGREIRLEPGEPGTPRRWTIGRAADNNIYLDDPSLSRFHASLAMNESGEIMLADLGSANGTFVNRERITQPRTLQAGDEIVFGTVRFQLLAREET